MAGLVAAMLPFDVDDCVPIDEAIRQFKFAGAPTLVDHIDLTTEDGRSASVTTYTNEFWTAKQRAADSLHEISYRACFKPQLPRFFIEKLTRPGDIVYDPFMGRGTTLVEAALMERVPYGCDVNPLSRILCQPRLCPPAIDDVERALAEVDFDDADETPKDLNVFYHPDTLRQISALRKHLIQRESDGTLTSANQWIRMVSVNRLTGHSPGFFSVYTMPPNQAVSARSQARINAKRSQTPPPRDVASIILKKSRSLLGNGDPESRASLARVAGQSRLMVGVSSRTPRIESDSVSFVVTSPPFLDVVDYQTDNLISCWFS